jgi:hypothetical protein
MKNLAFILLSVTVLIACRKGELQEGNYYSQVSVPFLFHDDVSMDLYIDGQLKQTQNSSRSDGFKVTIAQTDKIHVSIKRSGTGEVLKDTTINVTGKVTSTPYYAYSETYGFNRFFLSNEFVAPSQDSLAFIIYNDLRNTESQVINVVFYKDNDNDQVYALEDSVAVIKGLKVGEYSGRIVLPNNSNYDIAIKDAVTNKDLLEDALVDLGLPPTFSNAPITYGDVASESGKVNVLKLSDLSLEGSAGQTFNIYTASLLFKL